MKDEEIYYFFMAKFFSLFYNDVMLCFVERKILLFFSDWGV